MTPDSATPTPPTLDLDPLETSFDLIAPQGDLLMTRSTGVSSRRHPP